jgi:uncharacterized protein (DUF433 family)
MVKMASRVIHISEAEAARDFATLLAEVRAGAEVVIESNDRPVAVMRSAAPVLDWSDCSLVEVDPLRVSGRPVLKGTRMPVDDIIANYEYGTTVSDISEQFGIDPGTVRELLIYAERHHALARPVR